MNMKPEPLILRSLAEASDSPGVVASRGFVPAHKKKEETPPEPTFNETDLRNAEREGYQKGFMAGINEGRQQEKNQQAEIEKQLAQLSAKFTGSVLPLFEHYQTMAQQVRGSITGLAMAAARKVASDVLDEKAAEQISAVVNRCCESLLTEPQLSIRVNETLGDALENLLQGLAARLPDSTQIIIVRDPATPTTDCRIEWKFGAMQYSVDEIWKRLDAAVATTAATLERDHAQDMAQLHQAVTNPQQPAPTQPEESLGGQTDE